MTIALENCNEALGHQQERQPLPRAPQDEYTGMPLLLAPHDLSDVEPDEKNYHHPWGRKWLRHEPMPVYEAILRSSQGQRVIRRLHNGDKSELAAHRYMSNDGPIVPVNRAETVGVLSLAQMGYLPKDVIDTSAGVLVIRPKTEEEEVLIRIPRVPNVTDDMVEHFRSKWCPWSSSSTASKIIIESRVKEAAYSYENVDSGSSYNHVRAYINTSSVGELLAKPETVTVVTEALKEDDFDADKMLLQMVVQHVLEEATVKGMAIASLYDYFRSANKLYPNMPHTVEEFLAFRLSNPFGGIALRPEGRSALLEATKIGEVA